MRAPVLAHDQFYVSPCLNLGSHRWTCFLLR